MVEEGGTAEVVVVVAGSVVVVVSGIEDVVVAAAGSVVVVMSGTVEVVVEECVVVAGLGASVVVVGDVAPEVGVDVVDAELTRRPESGAGTAVDGGDGCQVDDVATLEPLIPADSAESVPSTLEAMTAADKTMTADRAMMATNRRLTIIDSSFRSCCGVHRPHCEKGLAQGRFPKLIGGARLSGVRSRTMVT